MKRVRNLATSVLLGLTLGVAACDSGTTNTTDMGNTDTLYARLGQEAGIKTVIDKFVARVVKNPKINGYFLNSTLNPKLSRCLVLQVANLTGGPQQYPSEGCRNMKDSHKGLGISKQDFDDLAADLVTELKAAGVAQKDIDTIVAALVPTATDIVEDASNNKTVYQRVGRKPAVATVVDKFIARVVANAKINGFFSGVSGAGAARLRTCLIRQVCSIDGPCKYGKEVDGESDGVAAANPCKDMKSSHAGLMSMGKGISKADFDALVADLVTELKAAGVKDADITAIGNALAPTCKDIVAGGVGCP